MRKGNFSKRDEYQKLKETVIKQESEERVANMVVYESGGSIDNLPVNTPEFHNWLELHRNKNPFIGKHVTAAAEYNVQQTDLTNSVEIPDEVNAELFDKINKEIPVYDLDEEELGVAPKVDKGQDKLFIDMLLIENSAKRLSGKTSDEIKEHAISMMRSYHDDTNYNSGLDVDAVVEQSKVLAIANAKNSQNDKKLLRNY